MSIGGGGNEFTGGGSSTILSLLPEGTTVKKGDVLCTLDSSAYEELLRQQQIALEQAQAEHRQAELELEVARLAVGEFENGTLKQTLQDYRGQIALARSDLRTRRRPAGMVEADAGQRLSLRRPGDQRRIQAGAVRS